MAAAEVGVGLEGGLVGVWAVLSSLVGNCGMFSAEFLEDTHQLEGMACVGLAPRIFQVQALTLNPNPGPNPNPSPNPNPDPNPNPNPNQWREASRGQGYRRR